MKIFLSYGHDDNMPLVNQIKEDMEKRGYEVWLDQFEIEGGDDWRRAIANGILSSQMMLACLSKHSTRDPGVRIKTIASRLSVIHLRRNPSHGKTKNNSH